MNKYPYHVDDYFIPRLKTEYQKLYGAGSYKQALVIANVVTFTMEDYEDLKNLPNSGEIYWPRDYRNLNQFQFELGDWIQGRLELNAELFYQNYLNPVNGIDPEIHEHLKKYQGFIKSMRFSGTIWTCESEHKSSVPRGDMENYGILLWGAVEFKSNADLIHYKLRCDDSKYFPKLNEDDAIDLVLHQFFTEPELNGYYLMKLDLQPANFYKVYELGV